MKKVDLVFILAAALFVGAFYKYNALPPAGRPFRLPKHSFAGGLELSNKNEIQGWAVASENDQPVQVELFVAPDNNAWVSLGTVKAEQSRDDVQLEQGYKFHCGFRFRVPQTILFQGVAFALYDNRARLYRAQVRDSQGAVTDLKVLSIALAPASGEG